MAAKPLPRTHRVRIENEMIKRREKQFLHDQIWNGRKQYYEDWEKKNTKFDEWTSPRYYESHSNVIEKIKKEREHEESLSKRREKLRKLLNEEDRLYEVELMIHKTRNSKYQRSPRCDEVPVEVLKELNTGLKLEEDDRRRHEAELKLYHQWRSSNPILKHYERMQRGRDLKLSWLDQQIENRMRKEREEEECRKLLKERDQMLKEEQAKYEEEQRRLQAKREELKACLEKQMEELKCKNEISDELKRAEDEERLKRLELIEIENKRIEEERKRAERECALYNIKQFKMRLKKKAEYIQKNLEEEQELMKRLKELEIAERIEDEVKKNEVKQALDQFLALNEEQKKLEKMRQRQLDFLFDSEAKVQYEQQDEFWKQEEAARSKLIKDVIATIQKQIDANLEKNKQKQLELVKEREEMVRKIEEYNQEMALLQKEEEKKRWEVKKTWDEDVKLKNVKKKARENAELKRIDEELERARKEEERLKQEIMNIQRRQGPIRPARSKIFL